MVNIAAAIAFGGQMLALRNSTVGDALASSVNVPDIVLWGLITLVLQFVAIFCLRRLLPGLPDCVLHGRVAPAVVYACGQLVTWTADSRSLVRLTLS